MKKKDLFKEICKFLLAGIGTKADKGIYSDLLGQISYLIYPKYDEYIDEVLQRIKGQIHTHPRRCWRRRVPGLGTYAHADVSALV